MSELLKNARVRMAALLTLLGASGVALVLNQDSCTVKLTDATDAGVVDAGDAVEVTPEVEAPVAPADGQ